MLRRKIILCPTTKQRKNTIDAASDITLQRSQQSPVSTAWLGAHESKKASRDNAGRRSAGLQIELQCQEQIFGHSTPAFSTEIMCASAQPAKHASIERESGMISTNSSYTDVA